MTAVPATAHAARIAGTALLLTGCSGVQSALAPTGIEAGRIAHLFWVLVGGGAVIFAAVIALTGLALGRQRHRWLQSENLVLWGGLVFPIVVLSALLAFTLPLMRAGAVAPDDRQALRIEVIGERWWWRVVYTGPDGRPFELANELTIPVGRPVEIALRSADVIHSFWVPRLAGKLDMIPGRTNTLRLVAVQPGISRGQCAEYCGGAHALMSFHVVTLEPAAFETWLAREAASALPPASPQAEAGRALFIAGGCGACHTVRGTDAAGRIGPDLTHVGARHSLAAATLPNDAPSIARWIRDNQHIKPENRMPPFAIFDASQLDALAAYLAGLK
jgi:cytochrome c oxidase subunit 2